jgi:hypothetical protein
VAAASGVGPFLTRDFKTASQTTGKAVGVGWILRFRINPAFNNERAPETNIQIEQYGDG